jgi:ketosteroid isomerase-like protein
METGTDIEQRVRRLEDIEELHQLVARYGQVVDDRDIEALGELYTADAVFDSRSGPLTGREAVLGYYRTQLASYGVTYHYPHSHVVDITGPDTAQGTVHAHAELAIDDQAVIVALRYTDTYRREAGRWRFRHRHAQQLYGLPLAELATRMGGVDRKHWPGTAAGPADIPETLPSWQSFWAGAQTGGG